MLELYTDRKKFLYCLQVCETFQALSAEIEGKGNSPVHSSKKHADLERVGRKKRMIGIKEYDLDIKLSKMVKGQGLCLLAAQSNVLEKE